MKERLAEGGGWPLFSEAAEVLGLVDGDKIGGGDDPSRLLLDLLGLVLSIRGLGDTPYLGEGEVLYFGEAFADFEEGCLLPPSIEEPDPALTDPDPDPDDPV